MYTAVALRCMKCEIGMFGICPGTTHEIGTIFSEEKHTSSMYILKKECDDMSFLVNFQSNWRRYGLCTACTNVQVSPKSNL
jgi:hypothetical protein